MRIDDTLAGSSTSAIHTHAVEGGVALCGRVKPENLCGNEREGVPTCPRCRALTKEN